MLEDHSDPSVLKHYHAYRRYDGHGVAVYIHKTLPHTEVTLDTTLEAVACRVKFNGTYLAICSLYLPSNTPIADDDLKSLFHQLPGNKLVLGDFNAHHQQWGSERSSARGEQIVNILLQTNLCLLNNGCATRVDDRTGNATAIDLSLASPNMFSDFSWEVSDDAHGSDHLPICISYSRDVASIPPPPKFNFKRADWATFRVVADVDVSGEDTDTMVSNATHSILHAAEACIPKTSTIHTKHGVPWWTTDCRQALRERNRRYRYFSQQPSQANFMAYKKARAQARKVILQAKRGSFREFTASVSRTTPLGQVWNTVHILSGKKTTTPVTTLITNGVVTDTPQAIANTLARQFERASSSASFHPAFLPRKEAAEQTVPNFATGGVNTDYNSEFT
ncbi:RTJK, partial [Enterospora canceri]